MAHIKTKKLLISEVAKCYNKLLKFDLSKKKKKNARYNKYQTLISFSYILQNCFNNQVSLKNYIGKTSSSASFCPYEFPLSNGSLKNNYCLIIFTVIIITFIL